MKIRHLQLPLALALALGAGSAHALGLGAIQVRSGLNEPLVAEIPILSASSGELDQLKVRLASPEAFARVGLERPAGLTANLMMEVTRNAAGQPVVRVTTPGRFNEPYLTFLIEAEWGNGRVVREFNALIDPPYIAPAVVRPLATPPSPAVAAPAPVPALPVATEPETSAVPDAQAAEPAPLAEPEPLPPPEPAPRPEPAPVAAAPQPQPQALPPQPQALPPPSQPAPQPQSQPQPQPQPQPVASPPAPEPVAGDITVADGQTLWAIAERAREGRGISINRMMVALQRTNPEAFIDDNINLLKSGAVLRIPGSEAIAALSDQEAALLVRQQNDAWQSRRRPVPQPAVETVDAAAARAPTPATRTPAPAGRLEIAPPGGDPSASPAAQSGASDSGTGSELRAELTQAREDLAARSAEVAELTSQLDELESERSDTERLIAMQSSRLQALQDQLAAREAAAAAEAPAPDAAPATADAPAPAEAAATPWYLNPFVLAGGLLILLGGLVMALRGRRSPAPTVVGRRISDDDAFRATVAARSPEDAGDAVGGETAITEDAGAAVEDEETIGGDPVQARLEQAVRDRPDDLEAHISLLRHLYSYHRVGEFEAAAQAMRSHVRSTLDPRWREAVVMGVALSPGNPLFSQAGWNTPKFAGDRVQGPITAPAPAVAPAPSPEPQPELEPQPEPEPEAPVAVAPAMPADVAAPVAAPPVTAATLEEELRALEADLTPASMPPADTSALDDDIELDLRRGATAEDDGSETKIELARAYLDIGDVDGARGMLEEVIAEAGPAGREKARQLLQEIG
ncbi:FimV/HubP family polar landmark protein [Arenimonas composti]|uniref:FimV N-terminal domain-containing protein n=1 Tax=Arenimonas composti TR7-09 = DSM 18010 TaxID=1121013 RepID=A0A091BAP7_9GAMM|nr:FimV/HubP family polar landmark protein [Arenimonas composti]KFN49748.1 hypothetical protein P873_09325 [Arenimonas composti TR7-09 = DSM 18010]